MNTIRPLTNESEITAYHTKLLAMKHPKVAMDIEGEFNLHCYGEHLCLVQIYDGSETVMIDPMALSDWSSIKALFEDASIEKVVYDRSSDASLLYNRYGISYIHTVDLRVAVALLEAPKQGLSSVLEQFLGVVGENKKKFQQYNWMKRPIDSGALRYAAQDVIHLFQLQAVLEDALSEKKLLEEFYKENKRLQKLPIKNNTINRHKKAKGFRYLNKRQQERFEKLFNARDKVAKEVNLPPNSVIQNAKLLDWCKRDVYSREGASRLINLRVSAPDREFLIAEFVGK